MSDIVLDGLHPNASCLQPAATPKDACEVEVKLRRRGDHSYRGQILIFRREKDRFSLASPPHSASAAFARGLGFSESDPNFQTALRHSLVLHKDLEEAFLQFLRKNPGVASQTLLLERVRNFLILGSIDSPDSGQRVQGNVILRDLFGLPEKQRGFFLPYLKSLGGRTGGLGLNPAIKEKAAWLVDLSEAHKKTAQTLKRAFASAEPQFKKDSELFQNNLLQWVASALVYVGTGEGDFTQLKTRLDEQSGVLRKNSGVAVDDVYAFFAGEKEYRSIVTLQGLQKSEVLQKFPALKGRLGELFSFLKGASRDGRAALLESPLDTLEKSIRLRLVNRGRAGELAPFVQEELKSSHLSPSWLTRLAQLEEIAEMVSSAFKEVRRGGRVEARLDLYRLKNGIERLLSAHGIQEREFTIGILAALRSVFGRGGESLTVEVWIKDRFLPVNIDLADDERKELKRLMQRLEWKVSTSLKRTQRYLPWIEGSLCAAGLALGGAGLGTDRRGLTVGGSTGAGLGCGALITHYLFRSRNPYIADAIGGGLGAGLGFGLSFFLTRPGRGPMNPPPPPPPPDLTGRNPVTGRGP